MQVMFGLVVSLLKGYLVKLASKEFIHWCFREIVFAYVQSTKTKEDDKWAEKIFETFEKE